MKILPGLLLFHLGGYFLVAPLLATEVLEETHTQVILRTHPKTGKPYVSIVSTDTPIPKDPFTGLDRKYSRPDYRLLDPHMKNGEVFYDGPVSDDRKVYIFAATLMTLGTVGGAVGMATAPVAASGATGGAGAYAAAGSVVAGGTTAAGLISARSHPYEEYKRVSESQWRPSKKMADVRKEEEISKEVKDV